MFLAKVCLRNENPDRYAAAICIRVRPDCCCADNFSSKAGACARYEWRSGPQPLSGRYEVLSNSYFFFFLADFFFFAFFAFLAMLPSVTPKLAQCKPTSTCINSEYTTISKLILSASNKVNDASVAPCALDEAFA
jgi:hypothetical protein